MLFVPPWTGAVSLPTSKVIPWKIEKDTSLMVQVSESGKRPLCFAEICCDAAQSGGVTEISLDDHDVTQLVKD